MVLGLDEAVERIAKRFAPAGREVAPWPSTPGHPEEELSAVEATLGPLPTSFRQVIARYSFLDVVTGNVALSHAASLDEWLVRPNLAPPTFTVRWWGQGERPGHLLMIGCSDAHTFLLDTDSGAVLALWIGDPSRTPRTVASSFGDFYRGLVTVYMAGLGTDAAVEVADEVCEAFAVGDEMPFWRRFAVGAA